MIQLLLPLIVEPAELEKYLGRENLLIVDLSSREMYDEVHIPGAVHLDPALLNSGEQPGVGSLPTDAQLSTILSTIGLTPESHVVAYDEEGGGWASRLLWTLDVINHPYFSLLNGGICSWLTEGHPVSEQLEDKVPSTCKVSCGVRRWVDKDYIMERLGDPSVVILDARSRAEFTGEDIRAERGGHIPGAVNLNWVTTMDRGRKLRLKPDEVLREMLSELGVTPDKEVIVYCQTHHRSSHTYIMLKALGFTNVKAYPGSWAEWGNSPDTPIEQDSGPTSVSGDAYTAKAVTK
jgi:thiosulfate/3-mercaptopyruvate sulfurtransferase